MESVSIRYPLGEAAMAHLLVFLTILLKRGRFINPDPFFNKFPNKVIDKPEEHQVSFFQGKSISVYARHGATERAAIAPRGVDPAAATEGGLNNNPGPATEGRNADGGG